MRTSELKTVLLFGDPRERGRAHGEELSGAIAELLERWGDALERNYGVNRDHYAACFAATTHYEETTRRLAPDIIEELKGIAEGSGVSFARILAFQHVNEEFELGPLFAGKQAVSADACSTIAVGPEGGQPGLIGQNLDLAQFLDGFQTLFRFPCDRSEGEIIVLSVPGMISLMGMNSHGFAICDNSLTQLRADPKGLPIYALYRLLLESRDIAEARGIIHSCPHAVGLNWVFGTAEDVAMIERSGCEAMPYRPGGDGAPAYHTNHPLACADWAERFVGDAGAAPRPARSSYLRFAALHQRIAAAGPERLTVEAIKAILGSRDDPDYPVSRGGGCNEEDQEIGFTLASNIFVLSENGPRWHLATGPGHATEYRIFGFE